jgi:hypothetical protein
MEKDKIVRATFEISQTEWLLFKTLASRVMTVDDDGTKRPSTASDILRELIWEWTDENRHLLSEALEDLARIHKLPEDKEEE